MAKIIPISYESQGGSFYQEIREILDLGGVIGFPTDTFYGLGANPWNPSAIQSIFSIKQRPVDKPILTLISSFEQLNMLTTEIPVVARKLIKNFWPGPLTLLFKVSPGLPSELTAGSGKIGLRLPANPITTQLIENLGYPLTATSANQSGSPNPCSAKDVENCIGNNLPLIVDGGTYKGGKASTILDVSGPELTIIRLGAITIEKIEETLQYKLSPIK